MKADRDVATGLLQDIYDLADAGHSGFDLRVTDTDNVRYISIYPKGKDAWGSFKGTCQGKNDDKPEPKKTPLHFLMGEDEIWTTSVGREAQERMENCQKQLKRLDRLMAQARGKVDGVVWREMEKASRYWVGQYNDAASKLFRHQTDFEMTLVEQDKVLPI